MTIPAPMFTNAALVKFKLGKIEGDILAGAKLRRIGLFKHWRFVQSDNDRGLWQEVFQCDAG